MEMFQIFLEDQGTYAQVFINNHETKRWNQKINFTLKNMEIYKTANHRVSITIDPFDVKVLIIQQVGGKDYELDGGEGACIRTEIEDKKELDRIRSRKYANSGNIPLTNSHQ